MPRVSHRLGQLGRRKITLRRGSPFTPPVPSSTIPQDNLRHTDAPAQVGRSRGRGLERVPCDHSLLINEMPASILLPASFVAFRAEWFFLAVADRLDPAGIHSCRDQCAFHSSGALVAECDVVLSRPALIAVT